MRSFLLFSFIFFLGCHRATDPSVTPIQPPVLVDQRNLSELKFGRYISIPSDVPMRRYFEVMDSLCAAADTAFGVSINEYELVHANHRLLDSLMAQDYYNAVRAGSIILNQMECIPLHKGDSLRIPLQSELDSIRSLFSSMLIDVNIPEFVLRIWAGDSLLHVCPVRVGKNERKFLALAGHEVNLRTPVGEGSIVRIERNPIYINPVDGHRYKTTRRDDGRYTHLPRIPFLEPEINGIRSGALIHPTTNRSTLGKAISNGCVGLSEADAWMVYYHAPLGTRVRFRYDLEVTDSTGQHRTLDDIYQKNTSSR
jgi:L,D-transpeptidase ErfK/SrfK